MATVQRVHTQPSRRLSKTAVVGMFTQWAVLKADTNRLTTEQNKVRDQISAYVEANGYQDDKGSYIVDLPNVVEAGGKRYVRIKRLRKVSSFFKEDEARALLANKGLLTRCLVTPEPVLDQNEVYVLHQEGKISDAEMDSLLGQNVSFAFTPEVE